IRDILLLHSLRSATLSEVPLLVALSSSNQSAILSQIAPTSSSSSSSSFNHSATVFPCLRSISHPAPPPPPPPRTTQPRSSPTRPVPQDM
ncbi:unnamed protein product, partial [Ilex paraguariensis]